MPTFGGTPQPTPQQLDDLVRQRYGSDAWMLDIPEVRAVLEQGAQNFWDQATLESKIRQTDWWKTTTQSVQQWQSLRNTSPAELDFKNPGSQAQQMWTQVGNLGAKAGVALSAEDVQQIAESAMKFKWNDQQINTAIATRANFKPGAGQVSAQTVVNQLQTQAANYFQNLDAPTLEHWAQLITAGTSTMDMFNANMKWMAQGKYAGAVDQLNQGLTMKDITASMRQDAARLMEVDPSRVDFMNDPTYQKVLQYVDPTTKQQRLMTGSEMSTYLRGTDQWGSTQQARDQVGSQAKSILSTFGVIPQ